jgi:hypothetical protein
MMADKLTAANVKIDRFGQVLRRHDGVVIGDVDRPFSMLWEYRLVANRLTWEGVYNTRRQAVQALLDTVNDDGRQIR